MAFFQLQESPVALPSPYPYDFHSHYAGILPLESESRTSKAYELTFPLPEDKTKSVKLPPGLELSIIGLMMRGEKGAGEDYVVPTEAELTKARKQAHYTLFRLAVKYARDRNPFNVASLAGYQRGECAAENIYLACVCILQECGLTPVDPNVSGPKIYQQVLTLLPLGEPNERVLHLITYFNGKIFRANKYTPFDDAYWARDAFRDEPQYKDLFALMTLSYQKENHVRYAQIATGAGSLDELDAFFLQFNEKYASHYTLLAHSAHVYLEEKGLNGELERIAGKFSSRIEKKQNSTLVGLDLLGSEDRTGHYKTFFEFLLKRANQELFQQYLKLRPNDGPAICRKIVLHIHCGEGSGISDSNRSLIGYYLRHATQPANPAFFPALVEYIYRCYFNTVSQASARSRERSNLGRPGKAHYSVSGLFDELFSHNNLTVDGLQLIRFNINSAVSQQTTAYNGKTNILHLARALDDTPKGGKETYYRQLQLAGKSAADSPAIYTTRVGHGYYYRNYISSKFPALYFDTNLGSNFITGASGLFLSTWDFTANRGLRRLDGSIDSDQLRSVMNHVAYTGPSRLSLEQNLFAVALYKLVFKGQTDLEPTVIELGEKAFPEFHEGDHSLNIRVLINIAKLYAKAMREETNTVLSNDKDSFLKSYANNVCQGLTALVANWRAYILGADGQGVEGTSIQTEALRMTLILLYSIDSGLKRIPSEIVKRFFQEILNISRRYWNNTIGDSTLDREHHPNLERFEGFQSPASVILVKAGKITAEEE